jgi:hypothetical protein
MSVVEAVGRVALSRRGDVLFEGLLCDGHSILIVQDVLEIAEAVILRGVVMGKSPRLGFVCRSWW